MEMKIKTKWGKISINPEKIHEVNVRMNTFENYYRIEFVLDGGQRVHADMMNGDELARTFKNVTNKMNIVRQYKFWDGYGLQVDEKRRMQFQSKLNEPNGD